MKIISLIESLCHAYFVVNQKLCCQIIVKKQHFSQLYMTYMYMIVYVAVQFGFWFNFDFPLFDIHYHILA